MAEAIYGSDASIMNKSEIYKIFNQQMAMDYSCSPEDVCDFDNHIFTLRRGGSFCNLVQNGCYDKQVQGGSCGKTAQNRCCGEEEQKGKCVKPGQRRLKPEDYLAKVISLNGKYIIVADERIVDALRACAGIPGEWISMAQFTDPINEITSRYGYVLRDQHHFYLPTGVNGISADEISKMKEEYTLKWYERDELEKFRGDERFTSALSFVDTAPDMIGLAAWKDGKILGMSGVSADSDTMWQIGINVMKEGRGRNLGAFLTILMKEEVMRRGKLPFYGTAESHIQSQKVAIKSGFIPTWYEAYWYRK